MNRFAFLVTFASTLAPMTARAGNDDDVLVGADAAMTAGAVTATTGDGSALWYNPAGLGAVDAPTLDVTLNAFELRLVRSPRLLSTVDGRSVRGDVTEFASIPASATYVRELGPKLRLGFGVFSPEATDVDLRATIVSNAGVRWVLGGTDTARSYYAGVGVGYAATERLNIGASVFAIYRSLSGSLEFAGGATDDAGRGSFLLFSTFESEQALGVDAALGVQWCASDSVRLGVSLRTPGLRLVRATRFETSTGSAIVMRDPSLEDAAGFSVDAGSRLRVEADALSPWRVRAGVAIALGAHELRLDADAQAPLGSEDVTIEARRWSVNARAGFVSRVGARTRVGLGVFTDRSGVRPAEGSADPIHFYGATAGVTWEDRHELAEGEERDSLTWRTTVALRYAVGHGESDALEVPDDLMGDANLRPAPTTRHELALYLGSSLVF